LGNAKAGSFALRRCHIAVPAYRRLEHAWLNKIYPVGTPGAGLILPARALYAAVAILTALIADARYGCPVQGHCAPFARSRRVALVFSAFPSTVLRQKE
jgi:hypothetical protein